MFVIVTYPWPVASAHVELTGPQPRDPAVSDTVGNGDTLDQRVRHMEQMIRWTDRERLRFQWTFSEHWCRSRGGSFIGPSSSPPSRVANTGRGVPRAARGRRRRWWRRLRHPPVEEHRDDFRALVVRTDPVAGRVAAAGHCDHGMEGS